MKKTILFLFLIAAVCSMTIAQINTNPTSGIVNVGQPLGFRCECGDGNNVNIYFGDGTSYLNVPPPIDLMAYHTYKNPGQFIFHKRLILVTTPMCLIDEYRTITVLENRTIIANPSAPSAGIAVSFTANNFNTPNNLFWDMGDGTMSANQGATVTHTYTKGGRFLVRAFDWNGDTKNTPVSLTVIVSEPVRMITCSPAAPRVDQEVAIQARNFKSSSIKWNFGDGTPPQVYSAAVAHRYQNPGTFTISAQEEDMPKVTTAITILPENRSLTVSVAEVRIDEPVTMTALNFRGPQVLWDFGDGSTVAARPAAVAAGIPGAVSGPITVTHAYKLPGNYTVTARDENGASAKNFQIAIRVLGISDQVNLEIAEITLDNGKYYKVVPKNSKAIRAGLRMKMRGTGIVSGFWVVDGQPSFFFSETVYQGQVKTIFTPEIPGLPVFDPGLHTITLQLTRPENEQVLFPTLRYFVLPYENVIATITPKDGAVIKEDEVMAFSWERALGGTRYQIAFSNSLFPLLRNDATIKWQECPERYSYTPAAEAWGAIQRDQWTYWKVRAIDSVGNIVGESGIQEIKVIVPGAKVSVLKITDMDGQTIPIGSGFTAARVEQLMIQGSLTYPAAAEYLILRVYAGENLVDQLLFRDIRKDEVRHFESSVPNQDKESVVTFQVLKSSSPSLLVGYEELKLKKY